MFIATLLALALLLASARPAHAVSTFTVNSTGDGSDFILTDNKCDTSAISIPGLEQCTLRAAIQQANHTAGKDTIAFQIGGPSATGVKTISPTSELPIVTQPVIVDGYTQPEASVNNATNATTNAVLRIELNGSNMVEGNGLIIQSGGTTIRGLVINRFKDEDPAFSDGNGIFLLNAANNTNNVIEGNFIGTDPTGAIDQGNEVSGVLAVGQATANRIGGADLEDRNLISGNGGDGVGALSSSNTIQGNLIGTAKNATGDLGNDRNGIQVAGSDNRIINNRIAFNGIVGFDGVVVFKDADDTGNRILSNSIFSNTGLGIDLLNEGPTPNDAQDPDTGPNTLQNRPVITSATTTGTTITILGSLNSTPNKTFTIQFFSSPSGNEGRRFLGNKSVTTNAIGNTGTFTRGLAVAVPAGQRITATATDPGGNTSEFSPPREVVAQ